VKAKTISNTLLKNLLANLFKCSASDCQEKKKSIHFFFLQSIEAGI
jgi:hypothetical protein